MYQTNLKRKTSILARLLTRSGLHPDWLKPLANNIPLLAGLLFAIIHIVFSDVTTTGILKTIIMADTSSNPNPIIIIDDDLEDIEIFKEGFKALGVPNEIMVFTDGNKFYDYISTTKQKSFFIFCDINMHRVSGFELKKKIFENEDIRLKCIPFLMLSTSGASASILEAYSLNVQGYFIKPNSISKVKELFDVVVNYWSLSQRPTWEQ